jgi:hypothetical protein
MSLRHPTQAPGDKMKKAMLLFSELLQERPNTSRKKILEEVSIKLDLSPTECEFILKHCSAEDF